MIAYQSAGELSVKRTLSVWEVWGSILEQVKSALCRGWLATVATFFGSSVAQTPSRADGPRHSLHALTYFREDDED